MSVGRKVLSLGVVTGLLLVASGCASLNAAQTANTMGKGGMQLGIEPAMSGWGVGGDGGAAFFPRVDVAGRYGLTDTIDIGGRLGSSFIEANAKFQLTDPANQDFVLSIAPSLGGLALGGDDGAAGLFNIALPVLMGFKMGDHQLVVGPRIQDFLVFGAGDGGGGTVNILGAGASVGMAFKVSEKFRIMPEVGAVLPIIGTADATDADSATESLTAGGLIMQFGLTFLIGKNVQGASTSASTYETTSAE